MSFPGSSLFGFRFTVAGSVQEVAHDIAGQAARGFSGKVVRLITPNASTIVYYSEPRFSILKSFYSQSEYVLADGMPVVWLSRLKGDNPLPARLTGSDLFPVLWDLLKRQGLKATMVLSGEELAARYRRDHSGCSTLVPKFFSADDDAYIAKFAEDVAADIISHGSAFLFLGLNFPKQEKLGMAVAAALHRLGYRRGVLLLLLGASFEFYFGLKKRAPEAFQKSGLEWLYRFAQEPGRLWRRYTVDNMRFLRLAIKELLSIR